MDQERENYSERRAPGYGPVLVPLGLLLSPILIALAIIYFSFVTR